MIFSIVRLLLHAAWINFELVLLSTLIFTYSNASNCQLPHYSRCAAWHDLPQIVWSTENRKKGLEDNQGWEKPVLKKTALRVFCFFLIRFWGIF